MTPVPRDIVLANGLRLQIVEQGDPDGTPLILLHGYSDSWFSWSSVLPRLPESIRAIAVSQRGHGDSERPASGYRVVDYATDVILLMNALGIQRAVIAGHSMGSGVAQRVAADAPGRVSGLILIGAFARIGALPVVAELAAYTATFEDPVDPAFAREFQLSTITRPVPDDFLETAIAESVKLPAHVWRETAAGFLAADASTWPDDIAAPTLILWGDQDTIVDRDQQEMLATIENSRLVIYAGIGHAVQWEEPERASADIAAFVAEVAGNVPVLSLAR